MSAGNAKPHKSPSLPEEPQAAFLLFLPTHHHFSSSPQQATRERQSSGTCEGGPRTALGHLCRGDPFPLSTVLPLPARGFLIVGLPLVLPIEEAFHLGRRCLLCPGWQGGSTLGWKCRFGLAVRGGRGNGTGLFGACSLLCSTVDHFICVRGFCHLGTSERPFS